MGTALGIAIGAAIGVVTDNIGLWLSLGIVFGVSYDAMQAKKGTKLKKDT